MHWRQRRMRRPPMNIPGHAHELTFSCFHGYSMKENAAHWLQRITVKHRRRLVCRFWQPGGGFDHNALEPKVIFRIIDYIHANPVRRGLVIDPTDWKWSSSGWHEGKNSLRPNAVDFGGPTVFWGGRE